MSVCGVFFVGKRGGRLNFSTEETDTARYEKALRKALKTKELRFMYQPIHNVWGQGIQLEMLVRWKYQNEWIPPSVFVPIIEQLGLISDLNFILVERLLKDMNFLDRIIPNLSGISLNISPYIFKEDGQEAFLSYLVERLLQANIEHRRICLEITESSMIDENAIHFLEKCKGLGFIIAIDDFGTGFASYENLGAKSFNVLKLDISLINHISSNIRKAAIVDSIINLAKKLNIKVVAEGVEKEEQYTLLKKMGVDAVQGYLFSRPQFIEDLQPAVMNCKK